MTDKAATALKAAAQILELIDLELKKIETLRELRRALLIMGIAPNIFDMGKVRTRVEGRMHYSYTSRSDIPTSDTMFVIIPENGEEVHVQLYEVPTELWPKGMLEAALRGPYRETVKKIVERETQPTEGETTHA